MSLNLKGFNSVAIPLIPVFLALSCHSGNGQPALSLKEFKARMEQQAVTVVDVRTPAEFLEGHVPKAINIDVKNDLFKADIQQLDTSETYMLYCRSGNRTKEAAMIMREHGFKNIFEMKGGFPDWEAAGYSVEK